MFGLEDALPPRIAKSTLYRVVGWGLRCYVVAVVVVGCYSLLWILDVAGLVSDTWLSAVWIAIAAMGSLFLVLLIPLFYASRSSTR